MSPTTKTIYCGAWAEETEAGAEFILPLHMDLPVLPGSSLATLQLALRHPENTGPSRPGARCRRRNHQRMRDAGFPAHALLMELGNDPHYDTPREEPRVINRTLVNRMSIPYPFPLCLDRRRRPSSGRIGSGNRRLVPLPAMIPLVTTNYDRHKIERPAVREALEAQAKRYGKKIFLVRFTFAEVVAETEAGS